MGPVHGSRHGCHGLPHERGIAPLVGVLALVAITVALSAVFLLGAVELSPGSSGPTATVELAVDAEEDRLTVRHVAGDPIDVEALELVVEVDDEPLKHQPTVPFSGTDGFDGAPSGPFNAESEPRWTVGERASLWLAGTNEPTIEPGDEVSVRLVVDDRTVATASATA